MLQDTLANALNTMKNAEKVGKLECIIKTSKVIGAVLKIMQDKGYIKDFESINDGKGGKYRVDLKGKIIDTGVIKPRFSVKLDEYEKYEKRYLPAKSFGLLIISTPKGIMNHNNAREQHLGGKLLCYVY